MRWVVIGAGRCGVQLTRAMRLAGVHVQALVGRSPASLERARHVVPEDVLLTWDRRLPPCDAILIAVQDFAVTACAEGLAGRRDVQPVVALHTSGPLDRSALASLAEAGWSTGSFHPLVSFPSADGPQVPLAGVLAAIEGEEHAVRIAESLADRLAMRSHRIRPEDKASYHAGAAIAGNLTHVLVLLARETLERAGFGPIEARDALAPLAAGAVQAALEADGWDRLTGALARGDAGTVRAHLAALPPETASCYRSIALAAITRLMNENEAFEGRFEDLKSALTPSD